MTGLFVALLAAATQLPSGAVVERDVAVPMRDGVVLRAELLKPAGPGPFPVLVYRTPYDKRRAIEDDSIFARALERGYAVVVQDVRGRHASAGDFVAYFNEGRDGYDSIEWAAAQAWSNGSVGSFGLSYPGAVQWLAAVESPPHLKAMVPAMTFSTPRNFIYSGGVFDLSWIAWIWNNIAPDARVRKGLAGPRTGQEARARFRELGASLHARLPLDALSELRDVAPFYFEWLSHPPGDPWWDWCEIRDKYARVGAAVLNLSGWHDEAYGPEGALTNFQGLRAARSGAADPQARVVIGPWTHGVGATAVTRSGEREFGPAARIDYDEQVLRFLDRYVRGEDNGLEREPPVRVFVMGADAWREADAWPLPGTREAPLYLRVAGGARRLGFSPPPEAASSSAFVSDPERPFVDPAANDAGAHDYRGLASRSDMLSFDSEPLEQDLDVVGPIQARLFVSADAPDVDVWLKLLDVAPDGTAYNLMSPGLDVLRASYRDGGPERKLLEPGAVYELRLPNLVTGNRFRRGHRVRAVVCASFFPYFSRNLQTGDLETSSARARRATLRIHHDRERPSQLVLPVAGAAR